MKKGFTLIELLIVIAIIAIIAGAVLVAINPARRIAEANDSQRWSEINSVLSAVSQYSVDNRGDMNICEALANGYCADFGSTVVSGYCAPTTTPGEYAQRRKSYIKCPASGATCAAPTIPVGDPADGCDITKRIIDLGYLPSVPTDPSMVSTVSTSTEYEIWRTSSGSICVKAPLKSTYASGDITACR